MPGDLADRADSIDDDVGRNPIPATFRLLIDSIRDYAIFMLDASGRVATWNEGAARIKGYAPHEIIGLHFATFYTPEDVASGKCDMELDVASREGRFEDEGWRVRKDGTRFWANVVITALRNEYGRLVGFAKITRDLTERRKAEDDRIELARVQEASRLKDQFLATVSHELRTPLNAIVGWVSLLETSSDPDLLEKGLETIRRNAAAQATIVDDILDMSRIVTGKMRVELRAIDMAEIVRDAIEVVRPAAEAKDIQVDVAGTDQPMVMVGDPTRLQQTAWNFLSNAVKFSGKHATVSVSLRREESAIALRVHDTGQGISPVFLPYVFDPFAQADTGPARRVGGVGLGLAIVKHIVELHGGQVSVESEGLGKGASFGATLPVRALAPPAPAKVPAAPSGLEPSPGLGSIRFDGLRVLALDDEPDARELMKTLFQSRGASTHTAATAKEGREALLTFKPHIIISDIGIPGEDGYQFLRSVRALPKDRGGATPAIALTAYAYTEDRRRALEAGFNYHLPKPVNFNDLIQAVHNLVSLFDIPSV